MDPTALARIAGDAGMLPHAIDAPQRRVLFLRVAEAAVRAAAFLDERVAVARADGFWLPLRELDALPPARPAAPRGFVFHVGHCGSTLVSRLLDRWPGVLGLREPRVLRDLARLRDEDETTGWLSAPDWHALFARILGLLGRTFRPGESVVIKATSSCNGLVEPLLAAHGDVRVVLLHLPLESWLATLLKAPSRLDALSPAPERLAYLHRHFDTRDLRLHRLDEPEILALGWIAERARFAQLAGGTHAERILSCDFEDFLRDPAARLAAIAAHLGFDRAAETAAAAVDSDVMRAYSKAPDHAYGAADREHDLALARQRFGKGIARGLRFVERLAARDPRLAPLARALRTDPRS